MVNSRVIPEGYRIHGEGKFFDFAGTNDNEARWRGVRSCGG
jgi:hypothetical protein